MMLVGLVTLVTVGLLSALAPVLPIADPRLPHLDLRLAPPLAQTGDGRTWLGTDALGRDLLSRVLWGGRISLMISITSVVLSAILGVSLGLLAGERGGVLDAVVMRLVDLQLAIPFILLALAIVALVGPSVVNLIVVFLVTSWPSYARVVRGQVLTVKQREFVLAARAIGASELRLLACHIAPNVLSPVIIIGAFEAARIIIVEAALGFLGLGIQPPTPTWGNMLADGRDYLQTAWWLLTFPGLAIMVTSLSVNLLGDGLRDLLDPRIGRY